MKICPGSAESFLEEGQTDRQTDRQTDKQTDRQTDTETDRYDVVMVAFRNFAKALKNETSHSNLRKK